MFSGSGMLSVSRRPNSNCSREFLGPMAARGVLGRSSSGSFPKLIFRGLSTSLVFEIGGLSTSLTFELIITDGFGVIEGFGVKDGFGVPGKLPVVTGEALTKLDALPFPNLVPRFTSELLYLILPIPGGRGAAKSTMEDVAVGPPM